MVPAAEDDGDRRLREAFEPDSAAVARVVAGAFAAKPRRRPGLRIAASLAAAALLLVSVLFLFKPASTMAEGLRLEYIGGVALVEASDGTSWVLTPDPHQGDPHLNFVIVEVEK
jgi:peptidoglycan/LPS O-acetylase OafA/YrhL